MVSRKLPYRAFILSIETICCYLIASVFVASLPVAPFMLGSVNMTIVGVAIVLLLLFEVIPWRKLIR